jgi:hypothetical protein
MTGPNDLDRRLTDFLEDAPTGAPERTIVFALDHAAAHPRRRDVLAVLRRDPMGTSALPGSMRVLPLVAALALLALVALGAAFVGGVFKPAPVVAPPPIASPSSVPSPTPVSPTSTPTGPAIPARSPSPSFAVIHVDLVEHSGQDASIDVTDRSGSLVGAVSGTPGDGGSVADGKIQVAADPTDPNALVITWTGTTCDTTHALDIAPDRTLTITRPACGGDAIPADHMLRLLFGAPIDPATVTGTVVTTGA